ncbi:hypothetical protein SAMN05216266_13114 [Amycolatopsis marina]|uniref:DUF2933 domain-containing protein n=1 Tax=Amycolatopsis marina TaxID=490629 RepID=A0A1I1CJ70_9PSEU|nr:hypothetical protein [Amycolatopsis marina]SFB62574.1 hypothetical protein SAMN05216266_13114 [Amycolatopsis marina]
MDSLLYTVAILACPVGMGAMMWMMMRGQGKSTGSGQPEQAQQVQQLRSEIDELKAERESRRAEGTR